MPQQEKGDNQIEDPQQSNMWIFHASLAMVFFSIANSFLSVLAAEVGPFSYIYYCVGSLAVCTLKHLYQIFKKYRNHGTYWVDLNFIRNGKLRCINVVGFVALTLNVFMNTNMGIMSMWTGHLAQINVGVIAVIWSITPLLQAFLDYILFKQKLNYNLWFGMILMVVACALLSLRSIIFRPAASTGIENADGQGATAQNQHQVLASWVPVIFGLVTPCFFTSGNVVIRYLTKEQYGIQFTSDQLSTYPYMLINISGLIAGAFIWTASPPIQIFNHSLFAKGAIGSAMQQCAFHYCFKAICHGPQGPACAIMISSTIVLTFVEAIRHSKVPTYIEFISLVLGFFAAILLAAPDVILRLIRFIFCCNKKISEKKTKTQVGITNQNTNEFGQDMKYEMIKQNDIQ